MQGIEELDQPGAARVTAAGLTTAFVLGATARGATARGAIVGPVNAGSIIALTAGLTLDASDPPLATDATGARISGTGGVRLVAFDTPAVRFGTGVGNTPSLGIVTGEPGAIVGGSSAIALPLPGPSPPDPVVKGLPKTAPTCLSISPASQLSGNFLGGPTGTATKSGSMNPLEFGRVRVLPAGLPIVARKSANASPGSSPARTLV